MILSIKGLYWWSSLGSARNPGNGSPEPPPPPPRNHDMSNSSFNDSKESNEISEAECDRDHGPRGNYGGKFLKPKDVPISSLT